MHWERTGRLQWQSCISFCFTGTLILAKISESFESVWQFNPLSYLIWLVMLCNLLKNYTLKSRFWEKDIGAHSLGDSMKQEWRSRKRKRAKEERPRSGCTGSDTATQGLHSTRVSGGRYRTLPRWSIWRMGGGSLYPLTPNPQWLRVASGGLNSPVFPSCQASTASKKPLGGTR